MCGVDLQVTGRRVLARTDEEAFLLRVVTEVHRDDHARTGDAGLGRRLANLRLAEQLLQLTDACLRLALLLLGSVVAAVLLEISLFPRRLDPLDDLGAARAGEVVELALQPVVRLLGEPGDDGLAGLGHGNPPKTNGG